MRGSSGSIMGCGVSDEWKVEAATSKTCPAKERRSQLAEAHVGGEAREGDGGVAACGEPGDEARGAEGAGLLGDEAVAIRDGVGRTEHLASDDDVMPMTSVIDDR